MNNLKLSITILMFSPIFMNKSQAQVGLKMESITKPVVFKEQKSITHKPASLLDPPKNYYYEPVNFKHQDTRSVMFQSPTDNFGQAIFSRNSTTAERLTGVAVFFFKAAFSN